jgi:hypothetical protein
MNSYIPRSDANINIFILFPKKIKKIIGYGFFIHLNV